MKGIINKGLQEMVEAEYGAPAWEAVKERAGCDEPFFALTQDYPDESTVSLIKAAAEHTGLSPSAVMIAYGTWLVPNTLKRQYPTLFALAGRSAREVLLNMNQVHEQATRSIRDAVPPRFEFEELPDGRLLIHYDSTRRLCPVLHGLILGLGRYFDTPLDVRELACMHQGDDRCSMEVTFSEA